MAAQGDFELIIRMKPLSYFLQTSMLSTDTEASNEEDKDSNLVSTRCARVVSLTYQKVTITTVHSAKGLEWPVVLIPAGRLLPLSVSTLLTHSRTRDVPFVSMYRGNGDRGREEAVICRHDSGADVLGG
jgi:superfamily I DNA/RNA helicase